METKENLISKNNNNKSLNISSKEKSLHPFIVTNTNSIPFIVNINNNNKPKEKDEKKEKNLETKKEETKKEIKSLNPFVLDEFLEYDKFDKFDIERSKKNPASDRISSSINKLSKGDDMDILSELMSLCNFLSLSSERIGLNHNMGKLLEEICKNLTKTYLPEIVIYSLQCINYILDINPTLSFTLKKVNAISSIMKTISCIEDISCIDYVIKIFDKISSENSRILLENNVFESFLVNYYDFLNIYQKKSLLKICFNMTSRRISISDYNTYIKPAMNILINIIRIDDDDNNDHLFIAEKATSILYNIINNNKYGDLSIIKELITKFNIIENL